MLDFMTVSTSRSNKSSTVEVFPKFIMKKSKDLMVRGKDFYAIWDEDRKIWSTDEDDVVRLVDNELRKYVNENADHLEGSPVIKFMWDGDSGSIDKFHKYCQKQMRDSFTMLDEELIFSNTELCRENYASKRLSYPLAEGDYSAWDKIISTLYSEEERHKIEWCIGSIVSGDSKKLQKFMVLYGAAGTGKSTILNVVQMLFDGYYSTFDAKSLGSSNNQFALESFKSNPLVAIQHDGDLSRIEDNTRLNSLVSHEEMSVNEKFKGIYNTRFKCFLFMGTNRPVKITDGKSGLLRRLIDVHPTGNKIPGGEYKKLIDQIPFELGGIAWHCLQIYKEDPEYYDTYIPKTMLGASNDFYNFVCDSFSVFKRENGTTLKAAWEMYKTYCDEAKVPFPFSKRNFKEELKNYFWDYDERIEKEDGSKLLSYYSNFRLDIFEDDMNGGKGRKEESKSNENWLELKEQESIFDSFYSNCFAQYASSAETPKKAWDEVTSKLSDLDTSKLHYVQLPDIHHIAIDFDIKDADGNKSLDLNMEAAKKFPPTYAELSKGGQGLHLQYIYTGDPNELSRIFDENIEVKVFTGKSSLRRRLSKCNNLPIAKISSGLPLKEAKKMINFEGIKNEKYLRSVIKKHLNKEIMGNTKPSIDMIKKCLDEAYESGLGYDVSDMKNAIVAFAMTSNNQANTCLKIVGDMKFKSEEVNEPTSYDDKDDTLVFYDIEVFPNLFLVCYKMTGDDNPVIRLINPKPENIERLIRFKLVGFNNKSYDNHMIYACMMGYSNEELYHLSKSLINDDKDISRKAKFSEAYNLSYTDIYDFASAGNKKSLKKLEIEMGIHHQELGIPWDDPVPENRWEEVADYCENDVIATEKAFYYLKGDWIARQILADITGMTVNDSTNSLSQRIIFGKDRNPQSQFNYRDLAKPVGSDEYNEYLDKFGNDYHFRVFNDDGLPEYRDYIPGEVLPDGWSILPFFPGYKYEYGKSTYLGENIGEGGRVYSEPGFHGNVWDADTTSQHPSSIIAEMLFGVEYTRAFRELVYSRIDIKHEEWGEVEKLYDGKLVKYIQLVKDGVLTSKELANAFKTAINAVYGQTKASYPCAFRDNRNVDNIVAKRGALFMTLLKREVQKLGYTVAHIKTDSIKIPDADDRIKEFVLRFGKEYGYSFETEAEFEKFCIVNQSVYIAKFKSPEIDKKTGKEIWWTATGAQFAVPYVFKTLFSKDPIVFNDLCTTFAASKGALYLDMNEKLPDVRSFEKEYDKLNDKYKKGELSDIMFEQLCSEVIPKISTGHDYRFVGKVGSFCPITAGKGGGILYRYDKGKYNAASGTIGYRWVESELAQKLSDDSIDRSYYIHLVDEAVSTISEYVDFEWFVSDDPYIPAPKEQKMDDFMNIPVDAPDEIPFDEDLPFA